MPTAIPRLSNVLLRVADLQRSLGFWRDKLGLRPLGAFESFAFLDAGGVHIGLNAVAPPKEPDGGLAALTEIVLEFADVRAAYADLSAKGIAFRTPPRAITTDATRELWACDCRDPDGHLVSITGWVSKRQPS
ncbi:MAG TPA: VOC family protein [Anaeromyxobacter sp.]|nr:VOC family protein [Anaeromyxobacter sp.]